LRQTITCGTPAIVADGFAVASGLAPRWAAKQPHWQPQRTF